MALQWLAAVLHPRDIGWHPNFPTPSYDAQAHVRLASRLTGDPWRWSPWRYNNEAEPWQEDSLVDLALTCLDPSVTLVQAHDLANSLLLADGDRLRVTPVALIACSVLSRLEEYDLVFSIIDNMSESLASWEGSPETPLLRAAIEQQRALRLKDTGEEFRDAVSAAVGHLREFIPENCASFELSPAAGWSSTATVQAVHDDLLDAAATLLTWDDDDLGASLGLPTSFELIRRSSSPILNTSNRHRAHVLGDLIKARTGRAPNASGQSEPAEELFYVNVQHEVLGHGRTYATRAEYAAFCLAEEYSLNDYEIVATLRHSKDDKLLEQLLEHLHRHGPLNALAQDARQVIRQRLSPRRLGQPELAVLEAASELLAPPEAEIALYAVLESLAGEGPANRPGHHTHSITRRRGAWLAAANLATVCNKEEQVLERLFQEVADSKVNDQLVDHELSGAVYTLAKTALKVDVTTQWRSLLQDRNLNMPRIRDLFLRREDFVDVELPAPGTIEAARLAVNRRLSGGDITDDEQSAHARVVAAALEGLRREAQEGHYSLGGVDIAELAFFFMTQQGCEWLTQPLVDFLLDGAIPQGLKTQALDRLAEAEIPFGLDITAQMSEQAEALLKTLPGPRLFVQGTVDPFPAALRFLGRHGFLPDTALVKYIAQLIAEPNPLGRRQAARTISLMALRRLDIDLSGLAVALSNDSDLGVRTQAAVSIARYSRRSGLYRESLLQALDRLLAEDGLLAPMWMIGALGELDGDFGDEIRARLTGIARNHPSSRVRESAASVLAKHRGRPEEVMPAG